MQHCAALLNKEQCSNMCFGVSNDPENGPPYKFEIQEGHFTPDSNYGKVEIKFSRRLIAIFFRFIRRFLPENRQNAVNTIGKKYFTKWYLQNSNPSQGRVQFVICQNLEGCIEVCYSYVMMNCCTLEDTIVNTCILFTTNNIANVNSYHNYNYYVLQCKDTHENIISRV